MLEDKNKESLTEKKKKPRTRKKKYDSVSYLTGDIGLNIDRFNQLMGTAPDEDSAIPDAEVNTGGTDTTANADSCAGEGSSTTGNSGCSESLKESKRYVRRYYIRPQNIFCSNKAEIIKALIELDDANCSIYTLNNLGDEKDVSKLMNSDIIYYYDNGILYDKNKVKVMDYDLSIKKEENRKHLNNVNKTPDKEFKDVYSDRMTDATELEENYVIDAFNDCDYDVISADYSESGNEIIVSLNHNVADVDEAAQHLINCLADNGIAVIDWNTNGSNVFIFSLDVENAFSLDFDAYNAFGEKLTEAKENFCCICGEPIEGYGNNPEPFMSSDSGQCCDGCNLKFVIPMRLEQMREE